MRRKWEMTDISNLSLREKIGQTSQEVLTVFRSWQPGNLSELLAQYPVGSLFVGNDVINSQGNETSVAGVIAEFQRASNLPLSIAGDLENGAGHAVKSMTKFPHQLCLGANSMATTILKEHLRLTPAGNGKE